MLNVSSGFARLYRKELLVFMAPRALLCVEKPLEMVPMREGCRLAEIGAVGVDQVPDNRLFDGKTLAAFGDAHTLVVIDIALFGDGVEQALAFASFERFGRIARGQLGQLLPAHFKELEGGAIAVVKDRVGDRRMREDHKWRVPDLNSIFERRAARLK